MTRRLALPVTEALYDTLSTTIATLRANADAEPVAILIHPVNWAPLRRALHAGDGRYIWHVSLDRGQDTLWGIPVRVTTSVPINTVAIEQAEA